VRHGSDLELLLLAHASGEWIASDWPVCAISDTVTPRPMGAALTYARRYALFTLVGITGEDDLDAPDLQTPSSQREPTNQTPTAEGPGRAGNGRLNSGDVPKRRGDRRHIAIASSAKIRAPDASATLRDQLIAELKNLGSSDDAALWAQRSLREKNTLTDGDAQIVEEAFQAEAAGFATHLRNTTGEVMQIARSLSVSSPEAATPAVDKSKRKASPRTEGIDKSV
jgi:ERF superfamily